MEIKKVVKMEVSLDEKTLRYQTYHEPVKPLTELEIINLYEAIPTNFNIHKLIEIVRKVEKAHEIT